MSSVRFLLNLCVVAVETDKDAGTRFLTQLSSVCSYKTFPFNYNRHDQSDFLLDLCSHVKNYETQTGRSYLPALQSVFQSPDVWIIDLSEKDLRPPGSAEAPDREENIRSEKMFRGRERSDEFPSVSATHLTAEAPICPIDCLYFKGRLILPKCGNSDSEHELDVLVKSPNPSSA
ncbi:hypothetical protein G5714_004176 [Onychostoma macrolepis]|uniref:Uncharacterized protein n=1 Tax=Onychostoma macrolepis TaxID=369639 RepID=A0A7J6DBI8_9TELE|nr:hypothetical protein G5714_004176 [Onychostoma macrolepis]